MESGLSLALPKLCLEHITAEIQHMATVRKGERELDRGREEKQKEQKKNKAGLTFGFSVSKTPPPSVACPHVSPLPRSHSLPFVSCPATSLSSFMLLLFLLSFSQNSAYLNDVFSQAACPPPTISFYSVRSLIKSLCEFSDD